MLTTHPGYFGAFLTALRMKAFGLVVDDLCVNNLDASHFPELVLSWDTPDTIDVYLWWKNAEVHRSIRMRATDERRLEQAEDAILTRAQSNAYCK